MEAQLELDRTELHPRDAPLQIYQFPKVGANPDTYIVREHIDDSQQVWIYCLLFIPP